MTIYDASCFYYLQQLLIIMTHRHRITGAMLYFIDGNDCHSVGREVNLPKWVIFVHKDLANHSDIFNKLIDSRDEQYLFSPPLLIIPLSCENRVSQ